MELEINELYDTEDGRLLSLFCKKWVEIQCFVDACQKHMWVEYEQNIELGRIEQTRARWVRNFETGQNILFCNAQQKPGVFKITCADVLNTNTLK